MRDFFALLFLILSWLALYCILCPPAEARVSDEQLFYASSYFLITLGGGLALYLSVILIGSAVLKRWRAD